MNLLKIGAAVVNQCPFAWEKNKENIVAAIEEARDNDVSILCLPELCITGYGCEDAFHSLGIQEQALRLLVEIAPTTTGMIVSLGLPLLFHKALYNCACLLVDGEIVAFVAKQFLAGEGVHYEPRWFKAWPNNYRSTVLVNGVEYPIGDIYFKCGDIKIGFEICEDAWVAKRPGSELALKGVDIILNPSASHFAFDKFRIRQRFVTEGSRAFGVAYVYTNLLGNESGRIIYDGGAIIATGGETVAMGNRFSFKEFEVTSCVIDISENRVKQGRTGSYRPEFDDDSAECIAVDFSFPELNPVSPTHQIAAWEESKNVKEEEFTRAVALALFDYLRKSRSRAFVVSLSGGADSAAVASLVALAIEFATRELGLSGIKEKLSHIPQIGNATTAKEIIKSTLLCVYQSTKNSSDTTRNAARDVAFAVGAEFLVLDVDPMVNSYIGLIENAIGRSLTWDNDDITLQNIQARARGPSVWMLANMRSALLLATSNRSEAAVGYATMDGDTCGGLSPIAGIDKAFLRQWLRWMETTGPAGIFSIPALKAVNVQAPTAELRPPEAEQTDEGDLMPYEILDAIEGAAIRDKHTPIEVFREIKVRFSEYSAALLGFWIERFFVLWCRNQWKRERYAPSFHLDDKNLDPKSWCRFPILSGGFQRELDELKEYIEQL